MNYFITDNGSGKAIIMNPVPPNADQYLDFKLILETIPPLPAGHEYVIVSDQLTTAAIDAAGQQEINDVLTESEFSKIERETKEAMLAGFTYDQNQFSLDPIYQQHWERIYSLYKAGAYSTTNVPTMAAVNYQMSAQRVDGFYNALQSAMIAILETERSKKETFLNSL